MIKVMLIDDEPEIRKLLHKMVERQPDYQVVAEGGDFSQAVTDFARYKPDVVFMDIDLNGESGLECARVLTELNLPIPIRTKNPFPIFPLTSPSIVTDACCTL